MKRVFRYIGELFLALIVVAATYHIWYLNKSKKEFKIYIDNYVKEKDATILNVQIENTGNQPLLKTDFSTDLAFCTKSLRLSEIETVKSSPTNLHIDFKRIYSNEVGITSELYNPKDKFEIQIIAVGSLDTLLVDARIIGVNEIKLEINDELQTKPIIILNDFESNKKLKILKATFGYSNKVLDVTKRLNNDIRNNSLNTVASFDTDPYPNMVKNLKIKYVFNGIIDSVSITEGSSIKIPKNFNHRL